MSDSIINKKNYFNRSHSNAIKVELVIQNIKETLMGEVRYVLYLAKCFNTYY
jgi:hypothetical protein